jgi:signal transduction histidine kinase
VNAQLQVVLIAAGCTSAVGLTGMGVIRLLRRASLRLSLQVSGAIVVLAVVAGTLGTAEAMFLSPHDLRVVVMVCMVAAAVAVGFGCLIGQQLQAGSLALRQAARSLGDQDGGYRSPAGPMMAELAALSRELGETSEKLKASREREHALDQSRRQLVAWVSHDLRTPLAGLHAMAEALEDGIAAEPARYHRQIRAEVARLARMVDDLFELSRVQAGTLRLSPGQIALEDLINDAMASTEALARARGIRLTSVADVYSPTCWSTPFVTPRRRAASTSWPRRRPGARCWQSPTAAAAYPKQTWRACSMRPGAAPAIAARTWTAVRAWDWRSYAASSRRTAGR